MAEKNQAAGPAPANRVMKASMVRVRARVDLAEIEGGVMVHHNPQQVFEVDPKRAKALGNLVEPA